jgi:hypothetical protein
MGVSSWGTSDESVNNHSNIIYYLALKSCWLSLQPPPPSPASFICIGNGRVINSSLVSDPGDRKERQFYVLGSNPSRLLLQSQEGAQ